MQLRLCCCFTCAFLLRTCAAGPTALFVVPRAVGIHGLPANAKEVHCDSSSGIRSPLEVDQGEIVNSTGARAYTFPLPITDEAEDRQATSHWGVLFHPTWVSTPTPIPTPNHEEAQAVPCSALEWLVDATRRRRSAMKYCDSPKEPLQYEKVITEEMTDDELGFSALRRARMQHGVLNSLLAGLSTSVGAVIICQSPAKAISSEQMSFVLSFAAGAMASATLLEFWLPLVTSDNLAQDTSHVILFSGIGGIAFWLLSLIIDTTLGRKQVDIEEDCSARRKDQRGSSLSARFAAFRSATILMVTLTLHNIPEGFAVLMSALGEQKKSSTVMFAIAMHNIPEGVAIATPILAATGSQKKALGMTLVSGLAEPVGALLAWVLMHVTGVVTEDCIDHILCVVGGIMIAVVVMELMPDAMRLATARVWILGFAAGCTVVSASIALGA